MDVVLRPARPADSEACAALALEPPGGLNDIFDRRVALRVARSAFLASHSSFGHRVTLVAEVRGSVAGIMSRFPGSAWPKLRVRTGLAMLRGSGRPGKAMALIRRGRIEDQVMAPITSDILFVMSLAVLPGSRGRGIGRTLMDRAAEEARDQRLRAVALDVAPSNEGAVRFYRREGFETVLEHHQEATHGLPAFGFLRMERPV